jgi:hypothetical protein
MDEEVRSSKLMLEPAGLAASRRAVAAAAR